MMIPLALLAACLVANAEPVPSQGEDKSNDTNGLTAKGEPFFPITFWAMHYWLKSPNYEKFSSDEQYALIKDCNFNLVMGGSLEKAEKFGLKCASDALASTRDAFAPLWWNTELPTAEQKQKIVEAISGVDKKNEALWGYYLADEPGPELYPKVAELRRIIKEVDPSRPVFISFLPGTNAKKCIEEVRPDFYAFDHYPIFEDGSPLSEAIPPGFDQSNFLNDLANSRKASQAAGLKFIVSLLSCGHSYDFERDGVHQSRNYGKVTEARLRWQAYSALAYHAAGISWFTYVMDSTPGYEEPAIGKDWKPTKIYGWLKKLNREIATIGPMLQKLKSVGVYESRPVYTWEGKNEHELDTFKKDRAIHGVEGGLVTVGEFKDVQGTEFLMIVNRNVNESIKVQPQLEWEKIQTIDVFDASDLKWSSVPSWKSGQKPAEFEIAAGNGVLLRLNQ